MPASNYWRDKVYNASLRAINLTAVTTPFVALYTSDPTAADVGTEVSGGGYARKEPAFGVPTNGVGSNSTIADFGTASAGWGTITHWGIRDALTAGNLIFYGPLSSSQVVNSGSTVKIQIGDLDITIT